MIKSNLLVGISGKCRAEKNPELKKFGLNVQDVTVFQDTFVVEDDVPKIVTRKTTYGIGKDFVPFSQYSWVKDGFGELKQIISYVDGAYYAEDGFITNPKSDILEIPQDTLLIGFIRFNERYSIFVPVIGLIEIETELSVYDFFAKTYNEIYTSPRVAFLHSINNFEKLKNLALKHYSYPFEKLYRHKDFANGEFVTKQKAKKAGITDFSDWEIKLL